jgi:hypothetical protein
MRKKRADRVSVQFGPVNPFYIYILINLQGQQALQIGVTRI